MKKIVILFSFIVCIISISFSIPLGGASYDEIFPGKVGISTFSPSADLHVTGNNGAVLAGNYGQGDVLNFGAGTRLQWYPKKAAFRAGKVDGTQWNDANIGEYSFASGQDTTANAISSVVFGWKTEALNSYAMAVGNTSKALGESSFAIGNVGIASGDKSIAMGDNVRAVGASSLAVGYYNVASQDYTVALGANTKTYSSYETVLGRYNTEYTPANATGWDASDRLFSIGNGTDAGSKSNAMTVLKSGKVGIGTTSPGEKLTVAGIIESTTGGVKFPDGTTQISAAGGDFIPTTQYPSFDAAAPFLIEYALWVGYDNTAKRWKYYRDTSNTRGLTDPGNPNTWTVNGTTIGYFNGDLNSLPSGTHINNKYYPAMLAAMYSQDDIQIRIGGIWVDKYACTVRDVGDSGAIKDDDATFGGHDVDGSGQETKRTYMAFSQKRQASTGMTWFAAQQIAANSGKRLPTNEEWQMAAGGTARSSGNGAANGDSWSSVTDQDMSRYGCVGMAGNVWEWVGDWLQAGVDTDGFSQGELNQNWPAGYNDDGTWNVNGSAYDETAWKNNLPAALIRGGSWSNAADAGVFALFANLAPSYWYSNLGFRCVR